MPFIRQPLLDDSIDSIKSSLNGRAIGIPASGVRNRAIREKQYALQFLAAQNATTTVIVTVQSNPVCCRQCNLKNDNDVYSSHQSNQPAVGYSR